MTRILAFLGLAGALVLAACNNKSSEKKDDMAQFAQDTSFQDAHPQPDAMTFNGKGKMVSFATPDGKDGSAYVLTPATPSNKYLFVIHEWWGLNDHIKQESERLFDSLQNVTVMALDLYDGQIAANPDDAGKIMGTIKPERAEAIIQGALSETGADAKVATIGWCFGGGWSLRSSILAGKHGAGCVMYYGMPVDNAKDLAPLQADILGIFAKQDAWITPAVVTKFEQLAKATGKKITVEQYDADHAFANPSNPKYNPEASAQANAHALAFLRSKL